MRVALLCVLGLTVGCGDDGISVNTNESNFCEQLAAVICHNMYQCCTESEIQDELSVSEPRTENQCREDLTRRCDRSSQTLRDSIQAGRVQLDAARLNDCLNAVLAPDGVCGEVVTEVPWEEPCFTTPWVGTVQPAASCYFDFDCAGYPDADCGPDQKCKLKPTAGFPCDGGCASDYYCVSQTQTCAAKSDAGGMCTTDQQCNSRQDLYCEIPSGMTTGMCALRGAAGSACLRDAACQSFDCVPGRCQGTNFTCYDDLGCNGRCADDNGFCNSASDCGTGLCNMTGTTCSEFTLCDTTTFPTNTCVYPVQCVPGDCVGEPVCTAPLIVTDYCDAVGVVPSP